MVTFSKPLSIANAGSYYRNHYSATGEYYAPTEAPTIGQTIGKGAEALRLPREITAEQFEALLRGRDPITDAVLRTRATHGDVERAGWDMTLSPPKSISIQALVCGDTGLIEDSRQAAEEAIEQVERCALSHQHAGSEKVLSSNVCAVIFEHYDARESKHGQHGPMPQLHHHTFIMNMTQRSDGQWRALETEQMMKARPFIDAVYMSGLAKKVQQRGYSIVRGSDGTFELAGFTRKQIEAFSERSQDIERLKAERDITSPKAARDIVLETRRAKREHDPEVLKAEREALAVEHGISLDNHPVTPVRSFAVTPAEQARQSLDFAIRHTTTRSAVADHREIALAALKHGIGATDLEHVQACMAAQQRAGNLIAAGKSHLNPLDKYTTREMGLLERENRTLVRDSMNHGRPIAGIAIRSAVDGTVSSTGGQEVREWASAKKLFADQTEAAVLTLTTPKWASAIEGLAGTTKTTLVGAVKEFAEGHGWTVRGFGNTTGARNALSEAGVDSWTIAKLRKNTLPPKQGRELWIVDESSLLATVPVNALLKLALDRGIERLLFVGDQKQHLAIEAGSPLRQFLADNMVVAQLTTIRRQQDPGLRRVVELSADGRTDEAIDLLTEQNRMVEVPKAAERYERIAAEYLDAYEAKQNCLVVSPANDERKAINEAVRSTLIAHRYVASIGQEHQILISRDLTPPELQHARSYREGDVWYFSRGSKAQQIPKRGYLTVHAVNDDSLTLRAENGRLISYDPASLKGVQAYTAESRTIAVGDRLQWREPDGRRNIANGEYATIKKLDNRNIQLKFDKGRTVSTPLADARKVDLGYASTSHASQGSTVYRAILNIDSTRGPELVNERMFYVGDSRERIELRVYTDNVRDMRRAVARTQNKELALDVIEKQQPRQSQTQSTGMRI
jgi:conjugative relaxase-like TrwC/TraI family protein